MVARTQALCGAFAGIAFAIGLVCGPLLVASTAKADAWTRDDHVIYDDSRALVFGGPTEAQAALARLQALQRRDTAAILILASRYVRLLESDINVALQQITGEKKASGWFDWMVWQERHPEVKPHASFHRVAHELITRIDSDFTRFVWPGLPREIRFEEIVWGGVSVDGIPALVNPKHITPHEATYLSPEELVFGVAIDGDARAYPLRIMDWHEMFNDVVGGVPVALAYCTLCGAGILFDTRVEGFAGPLEFGSSGLLYRSNKLMYDRQTDSLWNQFTGKPVVGALVGSGIQLKILPVAITTWKDWLAANPATKVLSLETGHSRDYTPGAPYSRYFSSPDLMFPAAVGDTRIRQKDYIFGIRAFGGQKSWPVETFRYKRVVNDTVGQVDVVLIGDAATRTVRAYRRDGRIFEPGGAPDEVKIGAATWKIGEENLLGPAGEKLPRVAGHVAFWFAWAGYLGDESNLQQ